MEERLKEKTKKGLYWTFLNQFSAYGMQFVVGIIMARLLSPEDFGIAALPAVFIAVANVFVDGGFANALVRKQNVSEKDLSTSFYYSLIIAFFCYLLMYISSPYIADLYDAPILKDLLRITGLTFLLSPLATPQRIIQSRQLNFKVITKINIIVRFIAGFVGILLAYYGHGIWALVVSNVLSSVLSVLLNWLVVKWFPKTKWSRESFKYLWGYGNKLMLSSLIDTAYKNVAPLFIGKFYSPSELGMYNRAIGYANLPSQNVTQAIRGVTFPVLSKIQDDDERFVYNYKRILRTLCFIVFPLMFILAGLAKPLVLVMLTTKWEGCILLLQILCFSQMWYPIDAVNLNVLQVKGRSDLFLRQEIIKKTIGFLVLIVTLPFGITFFCVGSIFYSLAEIIIDTICLSSVIKVNITQVLTNVLPSLSLSIFIFVLLQFVVNLPCDYNIQIIVGLVVAILAYLGGAYVLKFSELEDVKFMLVK